MGTKVFAGKDLILTVNGKHITGAQALPNAYEYESEVERVTTIVGMDGSGAVQINPNKSGRLTVRLLSVHSDNDYFATLYQSLDLGGSKPPYRKAGTPIPSISTASIPSKPRTATLW